MLDYTRTELKISCNRPDRVRNPNETFWVQVIIRAAQDRGATVRCLQWFETVFQPLLLRIWAKLMKS